MGAGKRPFAGRPFPGSRQPGNEEGKTTLAGSEESSKESAQEASRRQALEAWKPRTELGRKVLAGEIHSIEEALRHQRPILESEIIDLLVPNLENDLLLVGQMKGKFGGGKRRAFRQTQKKTEEGNTLSFSAVAVVGNRDGYVGVGIGKSRETVPAREKALRNAKLNLFQIRRGSGSWETGKVKEPTSIPFKVSGKCGSVEIALMPAPKGTGLCVEKECQKILALAGIKDIWSKTKGQTVGKMNLISACIEALKQLSQYKIQSKHRTSVGLIDGSRQKEAGESDQEFIDTMAAPSSV